MVQGLLGELPCVSGTLGAGPRLKSIVAEADFLASVDAPTVLLIEPATDEKAKSARDINLRAAYRSPPEGSI